ncbi:MAG: DUF2914 domain-containing protein [Thiohalomonadales bacterium]
MKKLLYIVISFFFVVNISAEVVMLAEGEIMVLGTPASDIKPDNSPDTIQPNNSETLQEQQSGSMQGSVARSIFTTLVSEHEPIDKIEKLQSNNRSVYYFTELRGMSGQTAIHRWEFNGNVMSETKFTIAGPRWRVWSSKNLLPSWTGEWKVSVLNGVGDVISEDIFSYVAEEIPGSDLQQETVTETKDMNSHTGNSINNNHQKP